MRREVKGLSNEVDLDNRSLIQIEFEKDAVPLNIEGAHVVLVPWVVFLGEGVESAHGGEHTGLHFEAEGDDAHSHHHLAAGQVDALLVVEAANGGRSAGAVGVVGHGSCSE